MNQVYTQPGTPQIHWVYLTFKNTERHPLDRNNTVAPLDQDHSGNQSTYNTAGRDQIHKRTGHYLEAVNSLASFSKAVASSASRVRRIVP